MISLPSKVKAVLNAIYNFLTGMKAAGLFTKKGPQ